MKNKVFSRRNLIIMFFPVVTVLIVLALGLPQRLLTAVEIGEEKYSIAEYNYYFYEAYYGYANENYDRLDAIGLNLNQDLRRQRHDAERTWAEYFREVTLEDMREYTTLRCEAVAEGFDAAGQVAAVRVGQEQAIREYCVKNNVTDVDRYLSQLYDAGMTEETFYRQLANRTLAEAYRDVMMERLAPTDEEAEAYQREHYAGEEEYATVSAVIAYFAPAADRVTGGAEERQWDNAYAMAEAARDRAEGLGGGTEGYAAVAAQFSQLADKDAPDGRYWNLSREDLEDALEEWCFDSTRSPGDTAILRGESGWYLICFDSYGESNLLVRARQALNQENYDLWLLERRGNYPMTTNGLAMVIAR